MFVKFLQREFVTEGFITFSSPRLESLQLCFVIDNDEEVNIKSWFPNYPVDYFDNDNTQLDQPVALESCMLIAMSTSDLIHTKNLKNTRSHLSSRLGIDVESSSAVLER